MQRDMYGLPGDVKQRKDTLDAEREKRKNRRGQLRDQYLDNLATPPNFTDRGHPLFRDSLLDQEHYSNGLGDFFETIPADLFFQGALDTSWSRMMRLGSPVSNDFMSFLSSKLKAIEKGEIQRYGNVTFVYT